MKATVGNLRKMIKGLPNSAQIVFEDWDGAFLIKQNFSGKKCRAMELEEFLNVHEDCLVIVNERATENNCHKWSKNE